MSKFMNTRGTDTKFRRQLLATVSAVALLGSACEAGKAYGDEVDRPQIWIELSGQLSRLNDVQETFAPPLMAARPANFTPSQKFEYPSRYSLDESGKISFQPEGSDWVFSGSIRYGRSASNRHVRQQTYPKAFVKYYYTYASSIKRKHAFTVQPGAARFADTNAQNGEHHFVLDFQAGKDVGLGMFGIRDGSSTVGLGARFAQFENKSNVALQSNPDWHFHYKYYGTKKFVIGGDSDIFHSNAASIRADRSFHGIGPSLSWNASAPLMGNLQDSELTFDWGLNAALLFGRQRAKVHHQTTGRYHGAKYAQGSRVITYQPTPVNVTRVRSVTVPNIGGFAGLSLRYADAKLSLGYRGDFFFNAVDGGIDAHKSENRGFFGPFASISIGVGD